MKHRPRITILFLLFLVCCILTVMLFSSLPAHARPFGASLGGIRSFGPDSTKNEALSFAVTKELNPTLILLSPKRGMKP